VLGDKRKVIMVLREIVDRGENLFGLGSMIYSQLRKIVKIRKFLDSNKFDEGVLNQIGISSFEFRRLKTIAKDIRNERIRYLLRFSLELESYIRGYNYELVLASIEKFIVEMI
ncbi:MAG: hypothetical protein ACK4F9_07675, partial [Brevinematia bacterium]